MITAIKKNKNDNFVIVLKGLDEGEELLMVKPEDVESLSWRN